MNINLITFMNVSRFVASFESSWRAELLDAAPGVATLALDEILLSDWKLGTAFVERVKAALQSSITDARLVELAPFTAIPWAAGRGVGVFMCLERSPGLQIMSGGELAAPLPFDLLAVNEDALHCVANHAPHPAVFFHATLDRPQGAAAPADQ